LKHANSNCKKPKMDEGVAEALAEFVAKRERELPNNVS
jgi:trimethylamine:corrinoid methyltransferase-like protein